VQESKAQEENYFAHSMGNLPGRRMFQASTPRNAPPYSRGSFPDPTSVGGLPIPSTIIPKASRQSCAVRFITQPKPRGNWRGMQPSPSLKPTISQYWAAVFVPVYFASCMHICMHDLITPILSIPTTTQLPLPLTLPTLSAWNRIRARSQNAFFTSNGQTAYSTCKKDLHHKYAAIESQMITPPNIDSSL